jgi:hypothetical protein
MSGQPIRKPPYSKRLLSMGWGRGSLSHKRKYRSFENSAQEPGALHTVGVFSSGKPQREVSFVGDLVGVVLF